MSNADSKQGLPERPTVQREMRQADWIVFASSMTEYADALEARLAAVSAERDAYRVCDKPGCGEVEAYYTLAEDLGQPVVQKVDNLRRRAEAAEAERDQAQAKLDTLTEDLRSLSADMRERGNKAKEGAATARVAELDSIMDHNDGRGIGYFMAAKMVDDALRERQGSRENVPDDQPYVDDASGMRVWCDSVLPNLWSATHRQCELAEARKEFIHTYEGALVTLIMREDELRECLRRERSLAPPAPAVTP